MPCCDECCDTWNNVLVARLMSSYHELSLCSDNWQVSSFIIMGKSCVVVWDKVLGSKKPTQKGLRSMWKLYWMSGNTRREKIPNKIKTR